MNSLIHQSTKIGIFTHINPDGDALGSTLGMAGYLSQIGKEYRIFLPSEPGESLLFMIPQQLRESIFTWHDNRAETLEALVKECDLLVGMDFNTPDRIGGYAPLLIGSKAHKILIDHHIGPATEYFDKIYSTPETSSTCELAYELLKTMPEIDGDVSRMTELTRESLLTGMTTDTNNFANSTTPGTFRMASELIAAGTDREKIIQNLYFCYPERRIKAQGYILDNLLNITGDGVAYIILDRRIQRRLHLKEGDTEGFVNIPLAIKDVRMSILLKRETKSNRIRVSVRSKKGTSARDFAMKYYHGGGHEQASGGRLMIGEDIRTMLEVKKYVEKSIREFCKEQ